MPRARSRLSRGSRCRPRFLSLSEVAVFGHPPGTAGTQAAQTPEADLRIIIARTAFRVNSHGVGVFPIVSGPNIPGGQQDRCRSARPASGRRAMSPTLHRRFPATGSAPGSTGRSRSTLPSAPAWPSAWPRSSSGWTISTSPPPRDGQRPCGASLFFPVTPPRLRPDSARPRAGPGRPAPPQGRGIMWRTPQAG